MTPSTLNEVVSVDAFRANIRALSRSNPSLEAMLAEVPEAPLDLMATPDGGVTADWMSRRLASRHCPLEEAHHLVEEVDLSEVATVAVVGFGLGLHVEVLARRLRKSGIVVVFEPDLALLKAVLSRIDISEWVEDANILIVTNADDRAGLLERLSGMDAILMLGLRILEHPPSTPRLAEVAPIFTRMIADFATTARMNVVTTLGRSAHTVANLLANIGSYTHGASIAPLKNIAAGRLGIVVSAGPSLRRNVHLLAEEGIRDRVLIIATQTTLRPLLNLGIKPHVVAALDYHEISTRFYEGLCAEDVAETQLIIDPKVNPAVPAAWPGRIRSIASEQLDKFLGPLARSGDQLPACSTVAHLSYALARYFGCDPVALIGQDLGFTDGLYYAPGTAIHDVWLSELNLFNTIETMEWERIARHRGQLERRTDINGRTIYTDEQMLTYLQQFEAMFHADKSAGLRVIDASEGGVRKEGADLQPLESVLQEFACDATATAIAWPEVPEFDEGNREALVAQLESLEAETKIIKEASHTASDILGQMIEHQGDPERMAELFSSLEAPQELVAKRKDVFQLVDMVNQAGVFNRLRADRKLRCAEEMSDVQLQRAQLDRDRANVVWTADAAAELEFMLESALAEARGSVSSVSRRTRVANLERATGLAEGDVDDVRVAAVIPVDCETGGTGIRRDLFAPLLGSTVLEETLRRLVASEELAEILLLVPEQLVAKVDRLIATIDGGVEVSIVRCNEPLFGPEQQAIRVARACADSSWRGGLGGLTVYDEVFAPKATAKALAAGDFDGILVVGPDWSFLPVLGENGVDKVVRRFREQPRLGCTFNQGPPGVGGLVLATPIVEAFALNRSRHTSIGHLLGYRPEQPEHDLIARDNNVKILPAMRSSTHRFVVDASAPFGCEGLSFEELLSTAETQTRDGTSSYAPHYLTVEICTGRSSCGIARRGGSGEAQRAPMSEDLFRSIVTEAAQRKDVVLGFDGAGDPLRHPAFDAFILIARDVGIHTIHVRTSLDAEQEIIARLLASKPDVISVDLDGDCAATRLAMHGVEHWDRITENMEFLIEHRQRFGSEDSDAFALPWIVPRLQRRSASLEDLPSFFERWRRRLGVAVVDPAHKGNRDESIAETSVPPRYQLNERQQSMGILCDGTVPLRCDDVFGSEIVGSLHEHGLLELWRELLHVRRHLSAAVEGLE